MPYFANPPTVMKKKGTKIINDPVFGFISVNDPLLLAVVDHPWVQRLRRIQQLGKTSIVYPGAQHTRFQHVVGAMHLMQLAISTLRSKGHDVSHEESQAALAAILLHDLGHGPFSHVLEHFFVSDISHEQITLILMQRMNEQMNGALTKAIDTFCGRCRPFLHQLISSQLDVDRLDYLKRDSFFTGVTEGTIGSDRIIKMLNVVDDELVVEAKGIYSIEKFLIARRLMYWQVYLHKTVIATEKMLNQILRRARFLVRQGEDVFAPPQLMFFLQNDIDGKAFDSPEVIAHFNNLDDSDLTSTIKVWASHPDRTLAVLSQGFNDRRLFRIEISRHPFTDADVAQMRQRVASELGVPDDQTSYFVVSGQVSSNTYSLGSNDRINIMYSPDDIRDISEASDMLNLSMLNNNDRRYYLCYPKTLAALH